MKISLLPWMVAGLNQLDSSSRNHPGKLHAFDFHHGFCCCCYFVLFSFLAFSNVKMWQETGGGTFTIHLRYNKTLNIWTTEEILYAHEEMNEQKIIQNDKCVQFREEVASARNRCRDIQKR